VRTRAGVKPVFVSPGHLVSFRTAARLVLATCGSTVYPSPSASPTSL